MYMRIVAMNNKGFFIQEAEKMNTWTQRIISFEEFENYMKANFVKEYNEFVESEKSVADFFYNYGCTEKMIKKGESYIFKV